MSTDEKLHTRITTLEAANDQLVKLLRLEREYRSLIMADLAETTGYAFAHGWQSGRAGRGIQLRAEIASIQQEHL